MLDLEVGARFDYLFYLIGFHICRAFHDRDQILQYFFSLSYSFIPVDSFFIICPIYMSLLALERCRLSHFAFQVAMQIWGTTTTICIDVETELTQ